MLTHLSRQGAVALRLLLALTVLLGVGYPLTLVGAGALMGDRADGMPVRDAHGQVVGSSLLAQRFEGDQWLQPRPSASDWDALASAPSNLGPSNAELLALIEERRTEVAEREGVEPSRVPPDAVTASGSGLDPHISPEYAAIQVARIARATGLTEAQVAALVAAHTHDRFLGFLGQPVVEVVAVNVALADLVAARED
ncbi:potassium-transporting ATPase subunit KdpC [Pseudactinotalea suaedae]|uniref:potassium-transporting ATPase subunit KdpC n=1 Tax=Pseudactinotalea suaedae TaxID=1524924 RepID=UPI0012E1595A|nr:potassium-transporting ATPase subunit KdpC [Pseudactinotalea suaedae]